MALWGEVRSALHPVDPLLFVFRSPAGLVTGFRLPDEGGVVIIRDHAIYWAGRPTQEDR